MELPDTHNPSRDQMSKEDIKRCQLQLKLQRELNHLSTSPAEIQSWSRIKTKQEENKDTHLSSAPHLHALVAMPGRRRAQRSFLVSQ